MEPRDNSIWINPYPTTTLPRWSTTAPECPPKRSLTAPAGWDPRTEWYWPPSKKAEADDLKAKMALLQEAYERGFKEGFKLAQEMGKK